MPHLRVFEEPCACFTLAAPKSCCFLAGGSSSATPSIFGNSLDLEYDRVNDSLQAWLGPAGVHLFWRDIWKSRAGPVLEVEGAPALDAVRFE